MYRKQDYIERIGRAVSPAQLVVISYEIMLHYLSNAKKYLLSDDKAAFVSETDWALACLRDIDASLNMEYDMAQSLHEIYVYANGLIINAKTLYKLDKLDEAVKILSALFDAFKNAETQALKDFPVADAYE